MANQLSKEKSLYLHQHKNNPVHWYAWGDEPFEKAKEENKPILVSIGYSSCHWCHVMAYESFENETVAEYLNKHFICIKLDKEEYPDIDGVYMDFMTHNFGHGGWPLNVFVNANKAPFFALTYLPANKFLDTLAMIVKNFNEREEFSQSTLQDSFQFPSIQTDEAVSALSKIQFDHERGMGPQFPMACFGVAALYANNPFVVDKELDLLITRGLFDHIEGGWFRYCVDPLWHIPHFEKMLYDQATLLLLCAEYYTKKKDARCEYAIRKTVEWLTEKMRLESNLFGSATDADTKEGEGHYYTLEDDSEKELFRLKDAGIHEGRYHPWIDLDHYMRNKEESELVIAKFKEIRRGYVMPHLDKKSVCSWNAFLGYALTRCATALGDDSLRVIAGHIFEALKTHHKKKNKLFHVVYGTHGHKGHEYLEDYSAYMLLAHALDEDVEATWAFDRIEEKFVTSDHLYHTTERDFNTVTQFQDMPFPSGGSMLVVALKEMKHPAYDTLAPLFNKIVPLVSRSPEFFGFWLRGLI